MDTFKHEMIQVEEEMDVVPKGLSDDDLHIDLAKNRWNQNDWTWVFI